MNYIIVAMLVFTLIPIIFGVLLGLLRGWRRAVLRLGLVLLSIILAFILCGVVADKVSDLSIPGITNGTVSETLNEMIASYMPTEGMAEALMSIVVPLIQSLIKVLEFLPLLALFLFLTWAIVFPICNIFVKPKKVTKEDGTVVKKHGRLIGAAVGLVQGVIVAACVGVVLTGIMAQANNVITMANDISSIGNGSQTMALSDGGDDFDIDFGTNEKDDKVDYVPDDDNTYDDGKTDYDSDDGYNYNGGDSSDDTMAEVMAILNEYMDSSLGKIYQSIGAKPFDWLSQVKTDSGTITLSGQIDAVRGVVDMAKELMRFQDVDFDNLLDSTNIDNIKDIFNSLEAIKDNMSPEAKQTIKKVLNSVGAEMGLPVDFSDIDLDEIDFSKEGEIFAELLDYNTKDGITPEDAQDIVEKMANSDIILDVLESNENVNIGSQLKDSEHRNAIEEKIDELESSGSYAQSKIDALRKIFGLNSNSESNSDANTDINPDTDTDIDSDTNADNDTDIEQTPNIEEGKE